MTPTEQDKELREQVSTVMYDTDYKHVIEDPEYFDKAAVDAVVDLITADRKRLALEARIDELETKRLEVQRIKQNIVEWSNSHEALGIGYVISHADSVDHIAKDRIAELKAQQEEV